jgi:hypothetical protein
LYGQLGSSTFKVRLQHLAASTTAYGRKQILFAKEAIELLRNGVKGCVVSEKLELNPNTVSKVKKIAKEMNLI